MSDRSSWRWSEVSRLAAFGLKSGAAITKTVSGHARTRHVLWLIQGSASSFRHHTCTSFINMWRCTLLLIMTNSLRMDRWHQAFHFQILFLVVMLSIQTATIPFFFLVSHQHCPAQAGCKPCNRSWNGVSTVLVPHNLHLRKHMAGQRPQLLDSVPATNNNWCRWTEDEHLLDRHRLKFPDIPEAELENRERDIHCTLNDFLPPTRQILAKASFCQSIVPPAAWAQGRLAPVWAQRQAYRVRAWKGMIEVRTERLELTLCRKTIGSVMKTSWKKHVTKRRDGRSNRSRTSYLPWVCEAAQSADRQPRWNSGIVESTYLPQL